MVRNGRADILEQFDRLVAENERMIAETEERLIEAQVELRVRQELERRAEIPKRSKMTPLQKSQYIRQHGIDEYNQLPWA